MVRRYSQFLEITYFLVDLITLNLSFCWGCSLRTGGFSKITDRKFAMLLIALNLIWFMVTTIANYYKIDRRSGYEAIVIRFVKVLSIQVLLTFTYISS